MTYRSITAETWLYQTVTGVSSVTATFGDRLLTEEAQDPQGIATPYLIVVRHPTVEVIKPLGNEVLGEVFVYDVVAYCDGQSTAPIATAMGDLDAVIAPEPAVSSITSGGKQYEIVTENMGELPPSPPPRLGEPPVVRLGTTYKVMVLDG